MSSSPDTAHTNRLAQATSPYLLQHQHNPVDWWQWGPEALAEAKRSNRPIMLSVGYAACHWCHVVAHASFAAERGGGAGGGRHFFSKGAPLWPAGLHGLLARSAGSVPGRAQQDRAEPHRLAG